MRRRTMPKATKVSFTDDQLEKALAKYDDAINIRKFLADKQGNEPSALALKMRILEFMMKTGKVYEIKNLMGQPAKEPSPYVEYGDRGVYVPSRFLIAMDVKLGTKFEPVKDKRGILLREVE
jgi:hypothetical protein